MPARHATTWRLGAVATESLTAARALFHLVLTSIPPPGFDPTVSSMSLIQLRRVVTNSTHCGPAEVISQGVCGFLPRTGEATCENPQTTEKTQATAVAFAALLA